MNNLKIKSIRPVGKQSVMDITVLNNGNYVLENGVVSHNSGLKYSASTIVFLSKAQVKDGTEFVGNIISCRLQKSRLTKEKSIARVELTYADGLSRYHGLPDVAVASGIWKKAGRIELQDGSKQWEKEIYRNPEKYFTQEVLDACDAQVGKMYLYGSSMAEETEGDEDESVA